ncbi:hypothetical protein HGI30_14950 [Paenibacillus albicereus]|uniref:DUF2187 domain-containing protein n=1 Tax=Paenibacillus albicereus TaxID=2726185 RepID=A0A6H2GZ87_9BACL|nr:hypothetical protein [Paenibacillus albicereus]QJC52730.1 hypothetical protein HGI30_14950 [Paenibacillus albicereus]
MKIEAGQKLQKIYDGSIVTVARVGGDHVVLDGDFEPNHVVMKEKLLHYYKEAPNGH